MSRLSVCMPSVYQAEPARTMTLLQPKAVTMFHVKHLYV
ncbi:hypothetical protein HMPREF9404_5897 [Eggerthella sp. HGA1]|nr:hypothetical protein HMPREF9404_5897 [Eggerthella sp. HGA1]